MSDCSEYYRWQCYEGVDSSIPREATCQRCNGRVVLDLQYWKGAGCQCEYPLVPRAMLEAFCNYVFSPEELRRIAALKEAGTLQGVCPSCDTFWWRDYPWPVRRCPGCYLLKPWADMKLAPALRDFELEGVSIEVDENGPRKSPPSCRRFCWQSCGRYLTAEPGDKEPPCECWIPDHARHHKPADRFHFLGYLESARPNQPCCLCGSANTAPVNPPEPATSYRYWYLCNNCGADGPSLAELERNSWADESQLYTWTKGRLTQPA